MKTPIVFRIFKNKQIYIVKQFVNEDRISIGSSDANQIQLDSQTIAPIHCLIEKRNNEYILCDLGSAGGTYLKDKKIVEAKIIGGESFSIGEYVLEFSIGSTKAMTGAVSPTEESSSFKERFKAGNGNYVQVLVLWQDRVVNSYQFEPKDSLILGPGADIEVPVGSAPKNWEIINFKNGLRINLSEEMKLEVSKQGETKAVQHNTYVPHKDEVCFVQLINGMQLIIRNISKSKPLLFDSPFLLGSSELAGLITALIIAIVTSLVVSLNKPKVTEEIVEQERLVSIVFTPPIDEKEKIQFNAQLEKLKIEQQVQEKKKEEVKKTAILEETKAETIKGDQASKSQKALTADSGQASEVKPKDPKLTKKMFTSTKQGAAVKTGNVNGANAQSAQEDPNNTGLLAAFGEGGVRNKLDQVYNGSGELLGASEKAKGVSGFDSNRTGDDLGSKAKDTGAGGNGTATQGIAGVGTKGRGTGMGGLGTGSGIGEGGKDRVKISLGGSGESFSGSIDREAVRRVVKSAYFQIQSCYNKALNTNSKVEGKVVLSWEIHPQGLARNVKVLKDKSTIDNPAIEECVRTRISNLTFPEPPDGTVAEVTSYPFIFQGQTL